MQQAQHPYYNPRLNYVDVEAMLEEKAHKWMQLNAKRYGDKGKFDSSRHRRRTCLPRRSEKT